MRLSPPPAAYDRQDQAQTRAALERAVDATYQRGRTIELQLGQRFILPSPDGTRWLIGIDNSGNLTRTAL